MEDCADKNADGSGNEAIDGVPGRDHRKRRERNHEWGGMYKRQMSENIINYVLVDNIDKVLANVEKLGGKIEVPKREIKTIGEIAIIRDTEGNAIGIWKSAMK